MQGLCDETHKLIARALPKLLQDMSGGRAGNATSSAKYLLGEEEEEEEEEAFEDPLEIRTKEANEDMQAAQGARMPVSPSRAQARLQDELLWT